MKDIQKQKVDFVKRAPPLACPKRPALFPQSQTFCVVRLTFRYNTRLAYCGSLQFLSRVS